MKNAPQPPRLKPYLPPSLIRRSEAASLEHLWSATEVAELFGVSAKTVVRWAKQDKIASVKTPGGRRRYTETVVREVYEAGGGVWPLNQ